MGNFTTNDTGSEHEMSTDGIRFIESFILCAIIFAAVVGNVSVWIIILATPSLRTTTNMFILSLSAADLLVSIANMPWTVVSIFIDEWPLSEAACVVFGFINMLTLVTSVMSLCNISINRYIMVCRPAKFKVIYTRRNAVCMIIGVVSLSIALSCPPLFGWGEYAYIPVQYFCFCDWTKHYTYAIFMIVFCFGGPCSVMAVCNIFIYRTVRKSRRKVLVRIPEASSDDKLKENANNENSAKQTSGDSKCREKSASDPKSNNKLLNPDENVTSGADETYDIDISRDYDVVVKCAKAENKNMSTPNSPAIKSAKLKKREEYRLAVSLIVVVMVFVICWFPSCVSTLLMIFLKAQIPSDFHMFTLLLGYANSCCNPIIYGLMNTRFASGFNDLYCCCKKERFRMPVISSP